MLVRLAAALGAALNLSAFGEDYIITSYARGHDSRPLPTITMSIDKSLRRKNALQRARSVLTRGERIKVMQDEERWPEGRSPFGLPKVKVLKVSKKPKKAKEEEKPAAEGEAAAPAAGGAAAPAAPPAGGEKKAAGGEKK